VAFASLTIKAALSSILYYITSHGYGHAVRSHQVIRALYSAGENVQVHVRTAAPEWLFSSSSRPLSYTRQSLDVGVIQPNSLRMDLEATFRACRELYDRMPNLVEQEVKFIKQQKIDLILGDIPPVCFEIAARANIPSVAITNFTWDVIYRAYTDAHSGFAPLIDDMTRFYGKATLALALPYPCDMSMFPRREAIPWVARASVLTRNRARAVFRLPRDRTIVLLSFGGLGLDDLPWRALDEMTDFFFVTTAPAGKSRGNLLVLDGAQRHYEDLLRAVDVIVTKPGYGIVADVLAHHLPVLYTERGEFPEYPFLVHALNDLATAEFIPQDELLSGNIRPYLLRLLEKDQSWPSVQLNGASVAAAKVLALLKATAES
jgi:UDP:flavonoid glycosyltransferase YjiC (YdhE family)